MRLNKNLKNKINYKFYIAIIEIVIARLIEILIDRNFKFKIEL